MGIPQHKNPTVPLDTACAPYNFVPLPEMVVCAADAEHSLPDHDRYYPAPDRLTGYFEVTLTTRSPL